MVLFSIALFAVAILTVMTLSLPLLDQNGILPFPLGWRESLRRTVGYCIDGNQVYQQDERVPSSNPGAICVCAPELGGVACALNRADSDSTD